MGLKLSFIRLGTLQEYLLVSYLLFRAMITKKNNDNVEKLHVYSQDDIIDLE